MSVFEEYCRTVRSRGKIPLTSSDFKEKFLYLPGELTEQEKVEKLIKYSEYANSVYTVMLGFDNIIEMVQVNFYDHEVREAIECISTYGDNCVEAVFKGEVVDTLHDIVPMDKMIERFDASGFFNSFCEKEDRERIESYKEILKEVGLEEWEIRLNNPKNLIR